MKAGNIQGDPFRGFVEAIVSGDNVTAIRLLDASPLLAKERAAHGATRQGAKQSFFDRILHYMYEGDTALHMAAAAYQTFIAEELIARGADVRAGTDAAQSPFTMPLMVGLACRRGTRCADKDHRPAHSGWRRSKCRRQERGRSVAPRSAQSLRCCRRSAHQWWCRPPGSQQQRLDTDAS